MKPVDFRGASLFIHRLCISSLALETEREGTEDNIREDIQTVG